LIDTMEQVAGARFLPRWAVDDVVGAVVVVDVLRAFTTAAYALAGGARHIVLVDSVDEALTFKAEHPQTLAMGEDRGRRVDGFDFSNSPVEVAAADLVDRVLVQRTSAGTRGVVAARSATRLWCASLVCASATAAAVRRSALGDPTYVITGRSVGDRSGGGNDDLATAELIERARLGIELDADRTSQLVATSDEARRTLAHGPGHADPEDVAFATRVDLFDFAMEVHRIDGHLRLQRTNSS
jgi:2-phosphosulfolactate phosphatase